MSDNLPTFDDPQVQAVYALLCDEEPAPHGEHWEGFAARRIVAALEARATRAAQALPCGHPAELLLKSAETGEPLYCELCDDKSGRRDAEARESELSAAALAPPPAAAAEARDAAELAGAPLSLPQAVARVLAKWDRPAVHDTAMRHLMDDLRAALAAHQKGGGE